MRAACHREEPWFSYVLSASAAGAIAGAVFILGKRALVDVPTVLIAVATLAVLVKVKKLPEPVVILAAGAAGVFLRTSGL